MVRQPALPWQPDPSRADDDPIPEYPTGGELGGEPPGKLLPDGGVDELLKDTPPSNPDVRKIWREEGPSTAGRPRGSSDGQAERRSQGFSRISSPTCARRVSCSFERTACT